MNYASMRVPVPLPLREKVLPTASSLVPVPENLLVPVPEKNLLVPVPEEGKGRERKVPVPVPDQSPRLFAVEIYPASH